MRITPAFRFFESLRLTRVHAYYGFRRLLSTGFAPSELSRVGGSVIDTCYPWGRAHAMSAMRILWLSGCALIFAVLVLGALYAQRPFREYPSVEYGESIPLPPDWQHPGEWAFARLMYPPGPNDGYRGRFDGDWRLGLSLWTQD